MAYTILPLSDESQWELFVLKYAPHALFQSWSWGEVQKKIGANVTRYGIFDGKTLKGVFQCVEVRARRGSFLHVRHGPVIEGLDTELWNATLRFLKDEAKRRKLWFVRMNPVLFETPELKTIFVHHGMRPAAIHRMDGEQCWVLDLSQSEEQLLSGMRKTTRYEIRRAPKSGIEVFSTTDPIHLKEFFSLYKKTSSRQGFVPHHGIREEFELFAKKHQAVLYLGKSAGETISAAIILYYGNQAIYHHGASVPSKVPASYAVQWEAIQDAKKRGLKEYNFWGIAPENSPKHPWNGITLFKKGFGGREVNYVHAHDLPVSPLYFIPRTIEHVRRVSRGYD
jgi:lipid II:glycine glycyltransferase (peptidoglycan interpeptide bridge formation enzyme)